jgi:hypothetical protein
MTRDFHRGEFTVATLSPDLFVLLNVGITCISRSNQVSYVQVQEALLTGKCSGLVGLAEGVHFVCIPQGGSQDTLSECLVLLPLVIPRENLCCASTKGKLPDDVSLSGACFGSQQDFLAQGATLCHKYLVPLYLRPKNISFPLITIVAILQCCSRCQQ